MGLRFNPFTGTFDFTGSATGGSYTDEQAQDAVGGTLTDSTTIDFTYDDTANTITASVKQNSIPLNDLSDVVISSPSTNQVLKYNGTNWENGTDSGGGGSATINQATIDFGSTEKSDEVFNIVDAGISATSKITAFVTWISSLGRDADEIMADPIHISVEPLAGSMNIYAMADQGTVSGKYAINYLIG